MIEFKVKDKYIEVLAKELKAGHTTCEDYLILDVDNMPYSQKTKIVYMSSSFNEDNEVGYCIECKVVSSLERFTVRSHKKDIKVTIEIL